MVGLGPGSTPAGPPDLTSPAPPPGGARLARMPSDARPPTPATVDRKAIVAGAIVLLGIVLVALSLIGLVLLAR